MLKRKQKMLNTECEHELRNFAEDKFINARILKTDRKKDNQFIDDKVIVNENTMSRKDIIIMLNRFQKHFYNMMK